MSVVKLYDRIGESFPSKKGGVLTIIGVSDEKVGRSTKHLVVCSLCSEDTELFPEPFRILYKKLSNGQNPCACTTYRYNEEQVKLLIKRKCKDLGHTFLGFKDGFRSSHETVPLIRCDHGTVEYYSCHQYINYIENGCEKCSDFKNSLKSDGVENYPPNVIDIKYENKYYYYRCSNCSEDWYVLNGYCNGWFKFIGHRLRKSKFSCRCNTDKYFGDENFRLGKAVKGQESNPDIEVISLEGDDVLINCKIHGESRQNYGCCCEGRTPKCCTRSGWGLIKGFEQRKDNLYFIHMSFEGESFIKIGRAFNIPCRQKVLSEHYKTNLLGFLTDTHKNIVIYEKFYHSTFNHYKVKPLTLFDGYTEVFSVDILHDPDFKLLVDKLIYDY